MLILAPPSPEPKPLPPNKPALLLPKSAHAPRAVPIIPNVKPALAFP
nr:MAG TPA: hypothetical protein [Crassvirales sp.]